MQDKDLQLFINDFKKVKEKGFIKSHRKHNTGIGKTYEDLLGVIENNSKEPDLHGFEIKSQRAYSGSYVTLFTKSPTMPVGANKILKDKYGSYDEKYKDIKVLHSSIFATSFNSHKSGYQFKLEINNQEEKIYLIVANTNNEIVDKSTYWTFKVIKDCITNKLSNLAYISAETKKINDEELFHFNKAYIYSDIKPFETFIELLKNGTIMFDIRIGAYKTGKNKGKPHDHGSGFRIKKTNMNELYNDVITL